MKKLTLFFATIFCFMVAINAQQVYVGTFDHNLSTFGIPGCFTNSGHTYVAVVNSSSSAAIYDSDFSTCIANFTLPVQSAACPYSDLSECAYSGDYLVLTQNLFNSDDNFEYVSMFETHWSIMQITGNQTHVLHNILVDEGFETYANCIIKIDNLFYILFLEVDPQYDYKLLVYRINQTSGLTKMDVDLPISVFPTLAGRSQQITVELGEGNNAMEVTVVNGLGQVIKRVPVEEGQREITIPAKELNNGLNVVNTRTEQGQGSCKIIVQ